MLSYIVTASRSAFDLDKHCRFQRQSSLQCYKKCLNTIFLLITVIGHFAMRKSF